MNSSLLGFSSFGYWKWRFSGFLGLSLPPFTINFQVNKTDISMISNKLKRIIVLSIALFYLHGLEEILTGFHIQDPFIEFFSSLFMNVPEAVYYVSHVLWWIFVPVLLLLLLGGKWVYRVLAVFGIVYVLELHHVLKALLASQYYSGMITAFFYPVFGYFYWRTLIHDWQSNKKL